MACNKVFVLNTDPVWTTQMHSYIAVVACSLLESGSDVHIFVIAILQPFVHQKQYMVIAPDRG